MKTVAVLSTGNELLHGTVTDTNSAFISRRLFPLSVMVRAHYVAGDDTDGLTAMLGHAIETSDIVIMTGGLGPTDDDNTLAAVERLFGMPPCVDDESLTIMDSYLKQIGMPMTENERKMVEIPRGARVIRNLRGLAPGFIVRKEGKTLIAMPGVPGEMESMMEHSVLPFLRDECGIQERGHVTFRVTCMKESEVNEAVRKFDIIKQGFEWGITAEHGIINVIIAVQGEEKVDFDPVLREAGAVFGPRFLDPRFARPEEEVVALLRNMRLSVSFAESCTGGLVSKRITDIPGSSDVFFGSIIAYDNRVKQGWLGVDAGTLGRHGAVSQETAELMAAGIRRELETDIGISITGIAGPGGGSESKPVGTVWFGLADANGVRSFTRLLGGDRDRVRTLASLVAIEFLRDYLKSL
ncbi:MAG: CinA family nicotinamide mononucleotide deamidase-related protein [Spirochaetes bacterium]|nr:CinA family nicotinamide mononucleotide deamidase-related protein [Spirochaetota bacterium]